MLVDGGERRIDDQDIHKARGQLGLPSDFHLVDATRWLQIDTVNDLVRLPLPDDLYVAVFEADDGRREYGVVTLPAPDEAECFSG